VNEQELQQLYAQVVALAQNIPRNERLSKADASVTMVSPLCGSQVTVDLALNGEHIAQFGQKVRACTLGAAAASIVAQHIEGASADELRELRKRMREMLKDDGPPPEGKFEQLAILESARDLISRHGSIMLIFDAIGEALDEIQGREKAIVDGGAKGIPDTVRA
jgi:NifU-like protein involved in Fe-S cluster formation